MMAHADLILTPEDIAAHNLTASHAAQARTCPVCGRTFFGAACAGWRIDAEGRAYARTGMCSAECVNADLMPKPGDGRETVEGEV
jgi:hypothetical protein